MTTSSARTRVRRFAAATCAAAAVAAGAASVAVAGPAVVEHFDDEFTVTYPAGDPDFFCDLDFDVVQHLHESGTFVGGTRGPEGAWYGGARFTGTNTFSNPANGKTYQARYAGTDRDQRLTDNGDGTVSLQVQQTGPTRWYVGDTLTFVDTGMIRFTLLFDTEGNELGFVSSDKVVGHYETDGRDFCTDLDLFLS
jgi:hypothetical protein